MNFAELFFHQPWVIRVGWTLVHFLWQGTVLALLFAATRRFAGEFLGPRRRYGLACGVLAIMTAIPILTFVSAEPTAESSTIPVRAGQPLLPQVLPWLVAIWFVGAMLFSARLISGWRMTSWLRSVSVGVVPPEWEEKLQVLIRRIDVKQSVRMIVSPLVDVPTVIGWLQPMILLPVSALSGLPLAQIEALLAHELAHIRRHDYLVNILQNIAEALLFYHPAIWWISRQIRNERELCCDDIAVEASGDVLIYVQALTDLDSRRRAKLKLIPAVAADGGSLVTRIRRLIGPPDSPSRNLTSPGAAWALGVMWLMGIAAATVHGAPGPASRVHPFVPPVRAVRTTIASSPQLVPMPDIQPSVSPVVTALLFDPFFQIPATPIPAPAATDQKPGRIEGTVMSATREPVKKPSVRLMMSGGPDGQQPMAYSESGDDAGKFVIEDLPPGRYTLTATKAGFVPGKYGARTPNGPGAIITLDAGATLKNLDITLLPQGIVSGRVLNEDGDPVAANLTFYRSTYVRGRKQIEMEAALRPTADDQGNFKTMNGVPPGRYYVSARPSVQPDGTKPDVGDVQTFYPNSLDLAGAVAIEVAAGARVEGVDIRLRREKVYSAKGKVTLSGAPVTNIVLELAPPGGTIYNGSARMTQVANGSFDLRYLLPGTYSLSLSRGVASPQLGPGHSGRLEFTVKDSNLEGLVLALTPGAEVTGSFKLDNGDWSSLYSQPASTPGQTTTAPPVFYPSVQLTDPVLGFFQNPMRVNSDGTFKLRTVPADRYLLDVTGLPQGTYVRSVSYGGRDVTRSPLDLQSGPGTLDIVLAKNAAMVSGIVRNEKNEPITGVQVTIWPKTPNPGTGTGAVRTIFTDQNGSFKLGNLAPDEYYVAAWDEIDSGLAQSPDFLGRFNGQATSVKLSEGSQTNIDVKMIPKDVVEREIAKLQ